MSKRFLIITVLVLAVGYFTRAFAFAQDAMPLKPADQPLTRAEAVSLLVSASPDSVNRARWFAAHMPPMPLFDDTVQTAWYAPYLETAFEEGWITGNTERSFRPDENLKEEEAIALATRYKEMKDPSAGVYLTIASEQGNWLNRIVSEAQANGIKMPFPIRTGNAILRQDFYPMIVSAGVSQPETIAIASIPVTTDFTITASALQPIITQTLAANLTTNQDDDTDTAPAEDPSPVAVNPSNTYFAVSMPSLGINDLIITHPTDLSHNGLLAPLKTGVGHLFSYPGQNGKILIYGHSSSYPWDVSDFAKIFRKINKLEIGERVYVNYHGTLYIYEVSYKQAVPAADTSAYTQDGTEELILYTCWPPDSIKERYLVHANLVETVAQN